MGQVIFAEYDSAAHDSWDSIREILHKRQKEREAQSAVSDSASQWFMGLLACWFMHWVDRYFV